MTTEVQDIPTSDHASEAEAPALVGLLAEFPDVTSVVGAAARVRAEGYKIWDVHSPFPIHGIDAVIGIRPTILPWMVLCGGLTGTTTGVLLQWFTNAYDYKFWISGKPMFSLPANIPVIFELTILFSALTAVFGMLALNRLPMLYNPIFKSKGFRRVTSDRFYVVIDGSDAKFDAVKTADFLQSLGASSVERIED